MGVDPEIEIAVRNRMPYVSRGGLKLRHALDKLQFELGRERVGRGGVVRSPADRLDALVAAGRAAQAIGLGVRAYCPSGLPGPAGNLESFIWCTEAARGGTEDLRRAAAATE